MEDRTIICVGGGTLTISAGMHVDPLVYLDRRFGDRSGSPDSSVRLEGGGRIFPYSIALGLGAAEAAHDALGEAIADARARADQPPAPVAA